MRRAIAAGLAAAILVAGSYGLSALVNEPTAHAPPPYRPTAEPVLSEVERLIEVFADRVDRVTDPLNSRELGRLHLERGQLTGDVASFGASIAALDEALELEPGHPHARLHLARASLAVHRFEAALGLGAGLVADDPANAAALLVVADAHLELGDTAAATQAVDSVQLMLGPIPPVLVRRALVADATGDVRAALNHAAAALGAARSIGEGPRRTAFHLTFVAHLLNDLGRYVEAETLLDEAILLDGDWSASHATLGAVLVSQQRFAEAVTAYERAAELQPDPGTLALIGDLYSALGDEEAAAASHARVEPTATASAIHEETYRRALARFLADRDLDHDRAVALARLDVAGRDDPFGHDVHAWTLYRAGRIDEARATIDRVFAVGLREPTMLYHSGLIAIAEGDLERARSELGEALRLAPSFHPLQAPDARRLLDELES